MATVDFRHAGSFFLELTEDSKFDPNKNFDKTIIKTIIDDTNQRHNREAVNKNVGTLVANAYKSLGIATSNVAA